VEETWERTAYVSHRLSYEAFPAQLGSVAAQAGDDGVLGDSDFIGFDNGPGHRSGIQSLQDPEDISIVACPGETATLIQQALITQCENMRYRFAILDGEHTPAASDAVPAVTSILTHRNNYSSAFAAYYTPWVQIDNGTIVIDLPPSGYVAGIYARVDNDRGVWKAPANEPLRNITGLDAYITTGEQDVLNPAGVDCIRRFPGRGMLVWGARTLSSNPEVKYVNVKRYLIYLEHSLDKGTQWVVFEPNAPPTWTRVVDSVTAFLHSEWRSGALFGAKPEDAFFVRCDETTMSADDIQNGRLICDIGVAIVRPAEFVIFRIEQITGFSTAA
jgi:phage tail sheath protein FI